MLYTYIRTLRQVHGNKKGSFAGKYATINILWTSYAWKSYNFFLLLPA